MKQRAVKSGAECHRGRSSYEMFGICESLRPSSIRCKSNILYQQYDYRPYYLAHGVKKALNAQ